MLKNVHAYCWLIAAFMLFTSTAKAQSVAVNEVVTSNQSTIADEDNSFEDWIELYNYGAVSVNLADYGLTDDPNARFKWKFPAVSIAPGQYLLIFASDKNRRVPGQPLHANFKISASGEKIVLTRADSVLVDSAGAVAVAANTSYGRQPDGTGSWKVFTTPTPNASNAGFSGVVEPPAFSHASGLYNQAFMLTLSHTASSVTIIYTLDGSEPDMNNLGTTTYQYKNQYKLDPTDAVGPFLNASYTSNMYSGPINIQDRSAQPDKYTRMNTRQHVMYNPPQPVRKATVVKAKAYINNIPSKTITRNFFVWPQGSPFKIPVISLQIQEDNLFDYDKGVYTAGKDFDTWRANNPTNNQWYRPEWGNYWRSGKDWEYPVHVEIFDPAGFTSVVSKNGGFRIHGNNSRALAIKSLRLYARDEGNFEYNPFSEKVYEATKPNNKEFKRIMLRGEGTGGSVYYDVVFNRLMQPFFAGVTRIRPAIHFINGEYWGITGIRDRFDEHHYALNYGLDPDNIVAVDCGGNNCEIDAGDNTDFASYMSMRDFIRTNNMADPVKFAKADSLLCMESFIDHMVLEIFAANDSYERTYWKARTKENNGYGDGRWRISIQDFEASFKTNIDWLAHWADITNSANETLFGHLLANTGFRNQFINRFSDLMNTGFAAPRFKAIIDTTLNEVSPYLAEDANRYPRDFFYRASERQNLITWAENRPAIQRDTIRKFFNLPGVYTLKLNVAGAPKGYVKVNTVNISAATPGVPEATYPWSGVYFRSVPVTLRAVAPKGFLFTHWSGDATGTTDSIVIDPNANADIVANFVKDTVNFKDAVYFWMMDSRIANDVPLQRIDATYAPNGLPAILTYGSCLQGYPFNAQHANWRKASLERRNAPTDINYRAAANDYIKFAEANMRGIQVKQPFKKDTNENTIILHVATTGLANLKLSFAASSDGAAQGLVIDYGDGSGNGKEWDTLNMPQSTFGLDSTYSLISADFSGVKKSENAEAFFIRIRFTGNDMTVDNGLRVQLNNISIDAEEKEFTGLVNPKTTPAYYLTAYPNPAANSITLLSEEDMQSVTVMNVFGQVMKTVAVRGTAQAISLEELAPAVYLVRVQWKDGERTIRVIKQ